MTRFSGSKFAAALQPRGAAKYAFELAIIGAGYFALAKVGLTLAAIYSSAVPIWLPAGQTRKPRKRTAAKAKPAGSPMGTALE